MARAGNVTSSADRTAMTATVSRVPSVSQSAYATASLSAWSTMPRQAQASASSSSSSSSSANYDDDNEDEDDDNEYDDNDGNGHDGDDDFDDSLSDTSDKAASMTSVGSNGTVMDPYVTSAMTEQRQAAGGGGDTLSRCFTTRPLVSTDARMYGHQSSSSSSFTRNGYSTNNNNHHHNNHHYHNHNHNHHHGHNQHHEDDRMCDDDHQTRAESTSDWMDNFLLGIGQGLSSTTSMGTLPLPTSHAHPQRSSSGSASGGHPHHALHGSPPAHGLRYNTSFLSLASADLSTAASVLLDRRMRGASDLSDDVHWQKNHMIGDVDFHDVFEEESQVAYPPSFP